MSYCRLSSDNWTCDVHCYGSVEDGKDVWVTQVATARFVGDRPDPLRLIVPAEYPSSIEAVIADSASLRKRIESYEFEEIKLPHAGETFIDSSASDCAARLQRLRDIGYRVPQYAIDALIAEAANGSEREP